MRGEERRQSELFHTFSVESLVPVDHPIRAIRTVCDSALKRLCPVFDTMYSDVGRPSIAPEVVLKAQVLMALYSVRSERQVVEQIGYNVLFRWFLGMSMSEPVFDATVFTKNRQRLIEHEVGREFLHAVVEEARSRKLLSEDHFSVDSTLIEAWASMKSFRKKDEGTKKDDDTPTPSGRNTARDFRGETRTNDTHQSTTDPDARLAKKSTGDKAKLAYQSHVLMENRNGFIIDTELTQASGTAEVEAALVMLDRWQDGQRAPKTIGADANYHCAEFVTECRDRKISPHTALHSSREVTGLDKRTTAKVGYRLSITIRKRIEEGFGWAKTIAGIRKVKVRSVDKVRLTTQVAYAALNIIRIAKVVRV
jgi:transposase